MSSNNFQQPPKRYPLWSHDHNKSKPPTPYHSKAVHRPDNILHGRVKKWQQQPTLSPVPEHRQEEHNWEWGSPKSDQTRWADAGSQGGGRGGGGSEFGTNNGRERTVRRLRQQVFDLEDENIAMRREIQRLQNSFSAVNDHLMQQSAWMVQIHRSFAAIMPPPPLFVPLSPRGFNPPAFPPSAPSAPMAPMPPTPLPPWRQTRPGDGQSAYGHGAYRPPAQNG